VLHLRFSGYDEFGEVEFLYGTGAIKLWKGYLDLSADEIVGLSVRLVPDFVFSQHHMYEEPGIDEYSTLTLQHVDRESVVPYFTSIFYAYKHYGLRHLTKIFREAGLHHELEDLVAPLPLLIRAKK